MTNQIVQLIALSNGVKLTVTDDRSLCGKAKCYNCINRREVPGNAHIKCEKPPHRMSGDHYGVANGWFMYPSLFDPTWMTSDCQNYEENEKGKSCSQSSGKSM